jgi:hypothetical protein
MSYPNVSTAASTTNSLNFVINASTSIIAQKNAKLDPNLLIKEFAGRDCYLGSLQLYSCKFILAVIWGRTWRFTFSIR